MQPVTRSFAMLFSVFTSPYRHWSLIVELTKREVLGRYRGASFGLLWSLFSPFLLLMVYSFAFGNIMKGRWPQGSNGAGQSYTLILFIGLIVHGFFAECILRAPQLVTGNVNYVKRVIFPLNILPWPMILSALFHLFANFLVFVLLKFLIAGGVGWEVLLFPVVMLPLVVLSFGVSWLLASVGVYFRDIGQIVGVLSTALLFTSSAFIPLTSLPEKYRALFELNPITFIIDQARNAALWNTPIQWGGLLIYAVAAFLVAVFGHAWFMGTRRGFADVI